MNVLPRQGTLFGPATGSEHYDPLHEDRYVVTHHGEIAAMGTHAHCMEVLHLQVTDWRIQHEEDYAKCRNLPYRRNTLVHWAEIGNNNFLWSAQRIFPDDTTPEPSSGLALLDFLVARTADSTRIFIQKVPVWTLQDGWYGNWKTVIEAHLAIQRASASQPEVQPERIVA